MKNTDLELIVEDSSKKGEAIGFSERLEELKTKITELREVNDNYFQLQKEAKDLANQFINDFRDNKVELGKIVSWLGDVIGPDELISIIGTSINHKELAGLNVKLQSRLLHNYSKPEDYMNTRITDLVNVLNVYDNYIEDFDSIEVSDELNCLDRHRYLISHDLQNLLMNGYRIGGDRVIRKEDKGIYLVTFKLVNGTLVYKYIKYPYIFYDTLYSYIVQESSSLVITNDKSVGVDYLFIMKYFFENRNELIDEISKITDKFKYKSLNSNSRGIYPRNIVDLSKMLLKGCPVFLNDEDICKIIKLVAERRVYDVVVELVKLYDFYKGEEEGISMLKEKLKKPKLEKYNFFSRLVFITDDLHSLVKSLKVPFNGDVNEGIQKWRGQSDSLSHIIDSIDSDFRKSLNRHNQYHVNMGNIPRGSRIGGNKFSYQNVHLNIGNVRWYSTKRYIQTPSVERQYPTVYFNIKEYIQNNPVNNDTQLKIEEDLYKYSYNTLNDKLTKSDKPLIDYKLINKKFSELLIGERVKLIDYIIRSRDLEFKKEPSKVNDKILYLLGIVLKTLKDDYIISIIYGRLFKIISMYNIAHDKNKAVNTFVDIGKDLVSSYFYELYIKHKKVLKTDVYRLSDWKKENNDLIDKFDDTVKGEMGGKIIGWLKNLDLIQIKLIPKGKKEREYVIIPTERILSILPKENKIIALPRRLPMIVRPRNYSRIFNGDKSKERLGGYLLNDERYTQPLIIPKWNFGRPTIIKDDNLVYDLVNNINSVGFKINKDLLDFLSIYGLKYNLIVNPNKDHPLSSKKKLRKHEYLELSSYKSKLDLQENILEIARIYSNIHEFYLPTRLDSRGRLNCISEYLMYQSNELAKALLLFSKPEKMFKFDKQSIDYLKAYGANCFGNKLDKTSWKNRTRWVDENVDKIINFKDGELIEKAEKKLLFITFCIEYNKYLDSINNEKDYFETDLPIQLDATCNGYQHLSLLSLDRDLAKELNLTKSTPEDTPKDFYNFIAVKVVNYFKDRLNDKVLSDEEREVYTRFSHLTITRKIVKKVIMTTVYNVSDFRKIDYLQEHFESDYNIDRNNRWYYYKDDHTVCLKETDFPILTKALNIVLNDDRFKLNKLLEYLNGVIKIVTDLGLPVIWGTPYSGVDIEQSYLKTKEERLKPFAYSKNTFKIMVLDRSNYNKPKQKISFLPNFIHSLDAAALALLVHYYFTDKSFYIKNIYTVHDCFAVTANNVKNITYLLSHVYQKIYTEKNYLREFNDKMIELIKYNRKNDVHFDEKTLKITTKEGKEFQFPSVNSVIGETSNSDGLVSQSSYLIH